MMAAVSQKDTKAELAVRKILYALGVHYRIRNRDLPGSPDIANRSSQWAIVVNGCFWHGQELQKDEKHIGLTSPEDASGILGSQVCC
jgi:DNA mismatch endonuclease Vsr